MRRLASVSDRHPTGDLTRATGCGPGTPGRRERTISESRHVAREPAELALPHPTHHLLHRLELLQERIDILRGHAAPRRDAGTPRAIDDRRVPPFLGRHRADDRLHPIDLVVVDLRVANLLGYTGKHREDVLERPHLAYLTHLVEEVVEGQLTLAQLCLGLGHLFLVEGRLRLLDERHHVAHPEDATRHAVGVERLEIFELLPRPHEEDGLAHNLLD